MGHLEFLKVLPLLEEYNSTTQEINWHKTIPLSQTRLETDRWEGVENIACVFVDLENSTDMAVNPTRENLQFFAWYGSNLIKILKNYDAKYLDFQGDGGFAIFDSEQSVMNAIDSAVSVNHFFKHMNKGVSLRIGIDIGKIIVKKVGVRGENKEIWLGRPVSFASKLCNFKEGNMNSIRISKSFYDRLDKENQELFETYNNNIYHASLLWGQR